MTKQEFEMLTEKEQKYILSVYRARVEYVALLIGGLKSWKLIDKTEEKHIKKIIIKLEDYWNSLIDVLEFQEEEKLN